MICMFIITGNLGEESYCKVDLYKVWRRVHVMAFWKEVWYWQKSKPEWQLSKQNRFQDLSSLGLSGYQARPKPKTKETH